jgi:hypothetical protein
MNKDKSSSSSTTTTTTPPSSSSSSSSTTATSPSLDPFLEGNVIKVKSGFYDGKLGYITGM